MLVSPRDEAALVPPYVCDVFTSSQSRYRLLRFEPGLAPTG